MCDAPVIKTIIYVFLSLVALPRWEQDPLIKYGVLDRHDLNFISVLLNDIGQVLRLKPYGCSIVVGVYSDEIAFGRKA